MLESQLNERDSLQDAANDLIAVGAAIREAAQRAYPATEWTLVPGSHGGQHDCGPPFMFLTGSIYELPEYDASPPASEVDRNAIVTAAADAARAHHPDRVDVTPGRSVKVVLPREHGEVDFTIGTPVAPYPAFMSVSGATGCHHAAPGPGPWDTPATPTPTP